MAKEDALTAPVEKSLARPSFLKDGDERGTEHITRDDIQMPRLGLAQGLSYELQEEHPRYIEGLKQGEMFNSLTKANYGKQAIRFTVVLPSRPRWVEFNPREEGGGVKDLNVPPGDPRTKWGPNGEKPAATLFYDFIIAMLPLDDSSPMSTLIALSFKSTGIETAKSLNTLMRLKKAPSFAGMYEITPGKKTNKHGTFGVFILRDLGYVDEDTFKACENLYESLKDRDIQVDREPGDDDPNATGDVEF